MGAVVKRGEPEDRCTRSCPGDDSASEPSGSRTGTPSGQSGRHICDRVNPGESGRAVRAERSRPLPPDSTESNVDPRPGEPGHGRRRARIRMAPSGLLCFFVFLWSTTGALALRAACDTVGDHTCSRYQVFSEKESPVRSTMTSTTAFALLNGKSDAFKSFPASPGVIFSSPTGQGDGVRPTLMLILPSLLVRFRHLTQLSCEGSG